MSTALNTDKLGYITNDLVAPVTAPKRGRGRPAKYAKEEREEKYKEVSRQWKQEHKEQCYEQHKDYYKEHKEEISKMNVDYHNRARYALKLLNDLFDSDQIEIKDEKYKRTITELIKNKKIISI
jgi:hypothetical protein